MITIIAAISKNNGLGKENKLLWHLPNDLKHFKTLTLNHPIIMGRKTYESIGKPLSKRKNIVISRTQIIENNIITVHSTNDAIIKAMEFDNQIFIIGGGEIYKQTIQLADILEITFVDATIEADTFFPNIDDNIWKLDHEIFNSKDENHQYDYYFRTYSTIVKKK